MSMAVSNLCLISVGINLSTWHREQMTPKNVVSIFRKHKIKQNFDFLSVDCESELLIVREILQAEFKPRILMMP